LGTFGLAGIFSFGTYKNINSWFGGLIVCRDQGLARAIREEMRQWPEFSLRYVQRKMIYASLIDMLGWQPLFAAIVHRIFRYGFIRDIARINRAVAIELDTSRHDNLPRHYQSRMSPGQARLILKQLPHVQAHARKRIAYASRYAEGIKATPSRQPPSPQGSRHVYTYYPLQAGSRQNLLKWLMFFHRDIAAQHLKNCAHLESFKEFYSPCPVADEVANSVILLPTYPSYGMNQVERNIQVINWYFAAGAPEFILEEASQVLKRQPWLETLPSQ
jgi:dTDP-4-amino-4,6-dideoxygalactose transaminase